MVYTSFPVFLCRGQERNTRKRTKTHPAPPSKLFPQTARGFKHAPRGSQGRAKRGVSVSEPFTLDGRKVGRAISLRGFGEKA